MGKVAEAASPYFAIRDSRFALFGAGGHLLVFCTSATP